ncbi:MAG: RluA family pseudouridine synthase [Saprospiraceae bacterium]|nr:RluA family pseudouridine synthase [Saprospiraceae bacterium]
MPLQEFRVPEALAGHRLRKVLPVLMEKQLSRGQIRHCIETGRLTVNEATVVSSGRTMLKDDVIKIMESGTMAPKQFRANIPTVYEDQDLVVFDKPAGWITAGNGFRTVENTLTWNTSQDPLTGLNRARHIHRLDAATSGVLMFAKTSAALEWHHRMFREHCVQKEYHALCTGYVVSSGQCKAALDGKEAQTSWRVITRVPSVRFGHVSHLLLTTQTGRTHQVRRHMSIAGHPLVGDIHYNVRHRYPGKGLFLHASSVKTRHRGGGALVLHAALPDKYCAFLKREERQWNRLAGSSNSTSKA